MLCIEKTRARVRPSWTDAHSVINGHEMLYMVSNCWENYEDYYERKRMAIQCCVRTWRAKTRTQSCARAFFWNASNGLKRTPIWLKSDFGHFKILRTRNCTMRTRTRGHIFVKKLHSDLKFHVMTYEIVMIIIQRDIIDMLNSQNGV